jgi:amino acid transporter
MAAATAKGFGFWTLTFLVVANMLGAGVFTTSGFTLASLRSPWLVLVAWLVGGLIAICGAFSYGLLVRRHPVSGGEYAFLSRSIHPSVGFIAGWVSLLAGFSGAIAFAALAMETYYLPGFFPPRMLAIVVVLIGALSHGLNRALGAGFQNAAVILKLLFLSGFLAIGAWSAATGSWQGAVLPDPGNTGSMTLAFAQALVWISLSYSGFNAGVYVAGEAETPAVVSRALICGTALVTALYLMLNATFVLAPPPAVIVGQADVAARAAQWIGGDGFESSIRAIIALALFTSVLSMMMAGPRVYGRMAEDGLLPRVFIVRPDRTWPAVLLQTGMAVLLILIGSVQALLAYLGLTLSLCAAASVAGLFFGSPEHRVKGWSALPPALFVLATLFSGSLLVIRDPWQAAGTGVTLILGTLAYRISRHFRKSAI